MLDLLVDPATYVDYHREIQVNDHVRVGDWSPAPTSADPPSAPNAPPLPPPPLSRRVAFLVSFRAPAWFKKAVGTETVKVRDGHELTWERDGGVCDTAAPLTRVVMRCAPRLWMPGGANEITIANVEFAVTPGVFREGGSPLTPSHGVTLTATVSAAAADSLKWLPGLRAALERVMLYQCEHMASTFVDVAARVAREQWGGLRPVKPRAQGPLPPIPLPPPLRALRHRELSLPGTPTAGGGGRRRSSVAGGSPDRRASARGAAVAPLPPPPRRVSAAGSATETEFHDALDALSLCGSQDGGPGSPLGSVAASAPPALPTAAVSLSPSTLKAGGAAELGITLPRVRTSPKTKVGASGRKKGAAGALRTGPPPAPPSAGSLTRSLRRFVCLGLGQ